MNGSDSSLGLRYKRMPTMGNEAIEGPMNDYERFEAFMKLADFRAMRWQVRRQVEWRISLGLWALMIASVYTVKTRPSEIVLICILLAILVMHAVLINELVVR